MEQPETTKQQTKGTPKALLGMKKKDAQGVGRLDIQGRRVGKRKRGCGVLQEGAWAAA